MKHWSLRDRTVPGNHFFEGELSPGGDALSSMTQTPEANQFGQNLSIALSRLNLSRGALAQQIGVDKSVVSRWATGQSRPSETSVTRLTSLIRQTIPDFSRNDWEAGSEEFSRRIGIVGNDETVSRSDDGNSGPGGGRLRLEGLRGRSDPANAALYEGLWAGFFHTSETATFRIVACCLRRDPHGMQAEITDGSNILTGVAIASVGWLQMIFEISVMHDRLWMIALNGLVSPLPAALSGFLMTGFPGMNAPPAVTATPMFLIQVGSVEDFDRLGGLAGLSPRMLELRRIAAARRTSNADLITSWSGVVHPDMLRGLQIQVGDPERHGGNELVPRMPRICWPYQEAIGMPQRDGVVPAAETRVMLRTALGLG